MKTNNIKSDFLTQIIYMVTNYFIDLIYTKVPHQLYIDNPTLGSELIQDSSTFRKMIKEHILDHIGEFDQYEGTVIYINTKTNKVEFYSDDAWTEHPFFDCSNITLWNYNFRYHNVTLAILN